MDSMTTEMRKQYWTKVIEECNNSGMNKTEWLKLNNINRHTYYAWQQKLRVEKGTEILVQQTKVNQSIEVPIIAELKKPKTKMIETETSKVVIKHRSLSVEINEGTSESLLETIIKVLSNV